MNIFYSPSGIVDYRHPIQGLRDMADAGLKQIFLDIGMYCSGKDLENYGKTAKTKSPDRVSPLRTPQTLLQQIQPVLEQCRQHCLSADYLRVPRLPWNTKRTELNPVLEQIAESAVYLCGRIGCRYLIVPPLFAGIEKGMEWQTNQAYYLRLAQVAREQHVILLLENQCRSYNGHLLRGNCSNGTDAAEWIDRLNAEAARQLHPADNVPAEPTPIFGFCLDTGICTLCGQNMQDIITALGDRLKAVILRDCERHRESSLLPFTAAYKGQSSADWLGLIRGLRDIHFDGSLILDFEDTAAAFSPLLRPRLLPLARSVAGYFRWQIGIESLLKKYASIVLFGAGNMCRNYMKCYGDKYPPLFTCDNNRAVWGTEFCGLEVKPPASLKELPDNCGVFICNIYYREIEQQLRDMGIINIEFFNDEYMPSFHFDRLDTDERSNY